MNSLKLSLFSLCFIATALILTSCGDDEAVTQNCNELGCPDGFTCVDGVCVQDDSTVRITSNISTDATWTSDKTYVLATRVSVLDGVTLNIEPGTVIKGEAGTGANSTALLVARGGKINACGTADAPIIFTSVADNLTPEDIAAGNFASPNLAPDINGLWGGVIILGKARISVGGDNIEAQIEGIPTSDPNGLYGGTDDADNSGSLCYVSIRHGGTNIGSGNEINGLTLGGVGSGTTINHIEIVANQDDGIEWFGGTVNVSNAVVWNNGDDAIDTDQAWAGTLDNFVIVGPAGSCFELDGPEGSYSAGHTIKNGHVVANPGTELSLAEHLIDLDEGSKASIVALENIYITGIIDNTNQIVGPPSQIPTSSFSNVMLDLPAGAMLVDYIDEGIVPAGVVAGGTTTTSIAALSWTWTARAGAF